MRRAEIVMAVLLAFLSIYLMWKSGEGPSWDPDVERFANIWMIEGEGPGSGFWPFWLSLVMLGCCLWIAFNWWRRKSPASISDKPYFDSVSKKMIVLVGGGLIAFLSLIEIIGFYGGIFIFIIYYLRFLGSHSALKTIAISTAVPIFSFFFFDVAMRIVLPKGYLEPLFIPLYDIFL